jgi:hypothetical protein
MIICINPVAMCFANSISCATETLLTRTTGELELKGNYTEKYILQDLKSGLLMWFKHCCGLRTSNVVFFLWKRCDRAETCEFFTNLSISIVGLLLAFLHSAAWVGLTVKDQYEIYDFRSFRLYVPVSNRFFKQGAFSSPGGAFWEMLGKIRV